MQRSSKWSEPRLNKAEQHIVFSMRPFDPPSSPPPTSPLPPLPEIAAVDYASPTSASSIAYSVSSTGRPVRPPRPQTSLPNLKPRTITSPDGPRFQRYSDNTIGARDSQTPQDRPVKRHRIRGPRFFPKSAESVQSHMPVPQTGSILCEDVSTVLSKLSNKASFANGSPISRLERLEERDQGEKERHALHEFAEQQKLKMVSQRKRTKPPILTSALSIPETQPKQMSSVINEKVTPAYISATINSCRVFQHYHNTSSQVVVSASNTLQDIGQCAPSDEYHKQHKAVVASPFDFGGYQASNPWPRLSRSSEDLTSLPRIPSDPVLLVSSALNGNQFKQTDSLSCRLSDDIKNLDNMITFAALPYSQTIHLAGPKPKTDKDKHEAQHIVDCDAETGAETADALTPEERRVVRRKRILWAIATITLVVIATGGILAGIICKLTLLR